MININFTDLSLDIFGGLVLGGLMYVITKAIISVNPAFLSTSNLPSIAGILMFSGMIFGKGGSRMYKETDAEIKRLERQNQKDEVKQ